MVSTAFNNQVRFAVAPCANLCRVVVSEKNWWLTTQRINQYAPIVGD